MTINNTKKGALDRKVTGDINKNETPAKKKKKKLQGISTFEWCTFETIEE